MHHAALARLVCNSFPQSFVPLSSMLDAGSLRFGSATRQQSTLAWPLVEGAGRTSLVWQGRQRVIQPLLPLIRQKPIGALESMALSRLAALSAQADAELRSYHHDVFPRYLLDDAAEHSLHLRYFDDIHDDIYAPLIRVAKRDGLSQPMQRVFNCELAAVLKDACRFDELSLTEQSQDQVVLAQAWLRAGAAKLVYQPILESLTNAWPSNYVPEDKLKPFR